MTNVPNVANPVGLAQTRSVRRSILAGGATAGGAWVLTACGVGAATTQTKAPEKLAPATLRLLHRRGQYEIDFHAQRNPAFEQKYPGVKLEMESTAGSDHYTKALAAAASGTPTDLIWSSSGSGGYFSFAVAKIARPIDDLITRDK